MAAGKGINSLDVKNQNRGLTLKLIAREQAFSRADVTKQIGLTKMTVSNIVADLLSSGYLLEADTLYTTSVGRNPIVLDLAPTAPKVMGIYLCRDSISVVVTDIKCNFLYQRQISLYKETPPSLAQKLIRLAEGAAAFCSDRLLGIGVAAMDPLDERSGTLLNPSNFFGIANFPIRAYLEDRFSLPVFLNNDMNASALAEKLFGAGKDLDNFIYIGITNGIGAGIIADGKPFRDDNSFVGEIGHMTISYDGPLCVCGNQGCLEVYANMSVLLDRLQHAAATDTPVSCEDFDRLAEQPACRDVFFDVAQKLSYGLINIANLLNPQAIFIGHEGCYLPAFCVQALEDTLNQRILAAGYQQIRVAPSRFGPSAPLVGSACCVLERLFAGKII